MVRFAVSKALKDRNLTHEQVGKMLGISRSSVSNAICQGNFTQAQASRWSTALGIEMEVFLTGQEPLPPNDFKTINENMAEMRKEIDTLRQQVDMLLADWSERRGSTPKK